MYDGDSFHTLTGGGQIAVLLLSVMLAVIVLVGAWLAMRGRGFFFKLVIGWLVF